MPRVMARESKPQKFSKISLDEMALSVPLVRYQAILRSRDESRVLHPTYHRHKWVNGISQVSTQLQLKERSNFAKLEVSPGPRYCYYLNIRTNWARQNEKNRKSETKNLNVWGSPSEVKRPTGTNNWSPCIARRFASSSFHLTIYS